MVKKLRDRFFWGVNKMINDPVFQFVIYNLAIFLTGFVFGVVIAELGILFLMRR